MGAIGTARKLWDKDKFKKKVQDILAESKDQSYTASDIAVMAYQFYLETHGKLEIYKKVKELDADGYCTVQDIARICGISPATVVSIKHNKWM